METFRVKEVAGNCNEVMCVTVQETATRCWKSTWKDQDRLPQFANLRLLFERWECLREPATEIASQLLSTRCEDHCIDLGIVHVDNDEIISSSRASIPRELGRIQEHQLRGAQDAVRCNVEADRGAIIRYLECIYDDFALSRLGWDLLCVMVKRSSGRKQKCMSTQIRCCVWERCTAIQKRMTSGKAGSENFNNPTSTQSCLESMDNQLSVEWNIFPGCTTTETKLSEKSRTIWGKEFCSCRCSTTSFTVHFEFQRSQRLREKDFSEDIWSFLGPGNEEKWCGTYPHKPEGNWCNVADQMISNTLQKVVIPFSEVQVRSTEESWKKKSMKKCDTLLSGIRKHWTFASHNSFVKSAQYLRSSIELVWWVSWADDRSDIHGSGQIHFKSDWAVIETCGSARCWFLDTKPNEDRGSRGKLLAWSLTTIQGAGSWRTIPYNLWISRIHKTSLCWNVPQNQWWYERRIWTSHSIMQRVYITSCSSGFCGQALDTKIYRDRTSSSSQDCVSSWQTWNRNSDSLSASGDNTNVWLVVCRDPNRYVDELRYKEPEHCPENFEEGSYGDTQEINAEQPTIQSRSQCSSSVDHIPIDER